ncbi:sensor histidine kinase [Streptomyces sp. NPDC003011]
MDAARGLEELVEGVAQSSAKAFELLGEPVGPLLQQAWPLLEVQLEVAVCHVTSEYLTNAVKHARGCRQVKVTARTDSDVLEVINRDDGTGGGAGPARGWSLIGLVNRVEAIGGRPAVSSPPGRGTTLTVQLPVPVPGPGAQR